MTLIEMLRLKADELERSRGVAGPSIVMLMRDAADQLAGAK